jgi:predicted nucleic acid-binding protein
MTWNRSYQLFGKPVPQVPSPHFNWTPLKGELTGFPRDVLLRPKFKFNKEHIETLLNYFQQNCIFVTALPLRRRLPDIDDEPFLEVAIAGRASSLITGNLVHYPSPPRQGVKVLSPSEFIDFYRKNET